MLLDGIGITGHASAAILFAALALWQLRPGGARHGRARALAFVATAGWALIVAARGPQDLVALLAEGARNVAWLGFMLALPVRGDAPAVAGESRRSRAGSRSAPSWMRSRTRAGRRTRWR